MKLGAKITVHMRSFTLVHLGAILMGEVGMHMGASEPSASVQARPDMAEARQAVVVVGIDGSEGSSKALAWAAQEARMRGAVLRVVHAWRLPWLSDAASLQAWPPVGRGGLGVRDEKVYEDFRAEVVSMASGEPGAAEASVASQIAAVLGPSPDVALERNVKEGRAAQVILEAAEDADLVVVGSRGREGFVGLLLGSVSSQVAQHAHCPVTIVHS
jgi:nucleotide-binding universal stress UspA family protein